MAMLKRSLLLAVGAALFLSLAAAPRANAGVVVSVAVGGPVYVHPVRPYVYVGPRYVAPPYAYVAGPVYPRFYAAPGPVYYRNWYPRHYVPRRDYYYRYNRGRW